MIIEDAKGTRYEYDAQGFRIVSTSKEQLDKKLDKTQFNLQFNQLLNPSLIKNTPNVILKPDGCICIPSGIKQYTIYNFIGITGHKYFIIPNADKNFVLRIYNNIDADSYSSSNGSIFNLLKGTSFIIDVNNNFDNTNTYIKPIIIDLTEMFGVGNEPKTVAEVQKYIPVGTYYPYTKGKASIEQVNSLSMVPSSSFQNDIFQTGTGHTKQTFTPTKNGYIRVSGYLPEGNKNYSFSLTQASMTYGFSRITDYTVIITAPVQANIECKLETSSNLSIQFNRFVYAKEV